MHHQGILHNDLKLENIMVESLEMLWWWIGIQHNPVLDISLPFHILHPNQVTRPFGSPCYMPPELAQGHGHSMVVDRHLLIGAMLYEILEGRAPRRGTTLGAVIQQACSETPTHSKMYPPPYSGFVSSSTPIIKTATQRLKPWKTISEGTSKRNKAILLTTVETVLREELYTYSDSHTSWWRLLRRCPWPFRPIKSEISTSAKTFMRKPADNWWPELEVGDLKLATAYLHHLSVDHDDLRQALTTSNTNEHWKSRQSSETLG